MNVHLGLVWIICPRKQDGRGIQNTFNQFAEIMAAGDAVAERTHNDIQAVNTREMNDNVICFTVDKYEPRVALVRPAPISVDW